MFMHSLGISVYPDKSDIKEVYEYMEKSGSDDCYLLESYSK